MINEPHTFTLDEICTLTETPRRTVRFYIQQGLVDRPEGASKRVAYYTRRHLEQLLAIHKWQDAGLSLERIRDIIRSEGNGSSPLPRPQRAGTIEVWSHIVIDDGVELHIEPGRAGLSAEQVRKLYAMINDAYKMIREADDSSEGSE